MRIISDVKLLSRFEKIAGEQLGLFREITDAAAPLDTAKLEEIINELTADRFIFAREIFETAKTFDITTTGGQKAAISRSYYAMYQASRAIIFHYERSDIDSHSALPERIPEQLPNQKHWSDRLDYWRRARNKVDYSPYPNGALDVMAADALNDATNFLNLCQQFLKRRGCTHV